MPLSDFLNNIKYWQRGNFKTFDFYKKINSECFTVPESQQHIPSLVGAKFGSCYIGYDNERESLATVQGIENFTNPSGSFTYNGVFQGGLYNYPEWLNKTEILNGNKDIVVYVELDTIQNLMNRTQTKPVRTINVAGAFLQLYSSVPAKVRYISSSGIVARGKYDESSLRWTPVFDETISGYYYIKSISYYMRTQQGQPRVKIANVKPVFPFITNSAIVSERVVDGDIVGHEIHTLKVSCNGVGEITLPSSRAYVPNYNNSGRSYTLDNANYASYSFTANSILPFLRYTLNISTGAKVLGDFNTSIKLDVSGCSSLTPVGFNIYTAAMLQPAYVELLGGNTFRMFSAAGFDYVAPQSVFYVDYFANPKSLYDIFADWGFYATDNIDDAINGETPNIIPDSPAGGDSGLNPDLPSGGGTGVNPAPPNAGDIPSNPENIIEDFPIEPPVLTATNLCQSYVYNYSSVLDLFNWFCSKGYIENQSELFADKLSAIYGLMEYPFDLATHDSAHLTATDVTSIVSVKENIKGYILESGYNTIIEGGQIQYLAYYGDFNDWTGCKYSVYVPYGGIVEVPAAAVVNRILKLQYSLDLLTGKATAILKSYPLNAPNLGVLVKLIPCQIGHLIPVQSNNFAQREISNTLSAISMASSAINGIAGIAAGGHKASAITSGISLATDLIQQGTNMAFSQQLSYCATGELSPSTGLGLPQTPFLSISRIHIVKPTRYKDLNGLPTAYFTKLSDIATGDNYISAQAINLSVPNATSEELSAINSLLYSGVFI